MMKSFDGKRVLFFPLPAVSSRDRRCALPGTSHPSLVHLYVGKISHNDTESVLSSVWILSWYKVSTRSVIRHI